VSGGLGVLLKSHMFELTREARIAVAVWTMGRNAVKTVCLSVLAVMLCEISCGEEYYTNQWAVHVEGGELVARHLAEKHGFTFVDTVHLLLILLC